MIAHEFTFLPLASYDTGLLLVWNVRHRSSRGFDFTPFAVVNRLRCVFIWMWEDTMNNKLAFAVAALIGGVAWAHAQDNSMSFFVTSVNPGKGGDLGGLDGADAYCSKLAAATGSSG